MAGTFTHHTEDMLHEFVAPSNPHPYLARLKDLAHNTDPYSTSALCHAFSPYLTRASHEEWHLVIEYAFTTVLGPIEWRLFLHADQLLNVAGTNDIRLRVDGGTQVFFDTDKVRDVQNKAFSDPPTFANFVSQDPLMAGVSRHTLCWELAGILYAAGVKHQQMEKCAFVLRECSRRLSKRDSLVETA